MNVLGKENILKVALELVPCKQTQAEKCTGRLANINMYSVNRNQGNKDSSAAWEAHKCMHKPTQANTHAHTHSSHDAHFDLHYLQSHLSPHGNKEHK